MNMRIRRKVCKAVLQSLYGDCTDVDLSNPRTFRHMMWLFVGRLHQVKTAKQLIRRQKRWEAQMWYDLSQGPSGHGGW